MKKDIGQTIINALPPRPYSDAAMLRAIAKYLDFTDKLIIDEIVENIEDEDERDEVKSAFVGREMQEDLERIATKVQTIDSVFLS